MEVKQRAPEELKPFSKNPKKHPDEQIEKIVDSIEEFGWTNPILTVKTDDGEDLVVAGHARLEAAEKLGLRNVPTIDLEMPYEKAVAYNLTDNKLAEMAEWKDELLAEQIQDIDDSDVEVELTGFDDDEISELLEEDEVEKPKPEGLPDNIEDWKILNLYSGIGGNRKFWKGNITAIEYNEEIAEAYQDFFPNDKVIVADAHEYLEKHFDEFDFIWSSPPCPTHSYIRKNCGVPGLKLKPKFPDMKLYEEILFLEGYFNGKWVIENVKSWYNPLIKPQEINRHYYWSNFKIKEIETEIIEIGEDLDMVQGNFSIKNLQNHIKKFGFKKEDIKKIPNLKDYSRNKIIRNLIHPKFGEHILKSAFESKGKNA